MNDLSGEPCQLCLVSTRYLEEKDTVLTQMTDLGVKSLVGPEDVGDEGKRDDLKHKVDGHGARDELPLLSPGASSCSSLAYRGGSAPVSAQNIAETHLDGGR